MASLVKGFGSMNTVSPLAAMRRFAFTLSAMLCVGCAATNSRVPVADIGRGTIVLGGLGRPVGQEVSIHGHKLGRHPMQSAGAFLVDLVDGQKLGHPVTIYGRGISEWPDDTEATVRGYEVATIRFEHIDDANYGPDDPRFRPHQVAWLHFEPSEVVEPKRLKIGDARWSFY